jgi:nucleotide-binding universal stress UspA family protein
MQFKKILCAVDDGPFSESVFRAAVALARDLKGEIALVNIMDVGMPGEAIDIESLRASLRGEAAALFQRLLENNGNPNVYKFIEEGNPKKTIVTIAREWEADMIVMASHSRKGLTRLLMGSVAETVLREAPCPVLIVPASHVGKI